MATWLDIVKVVGDIALQLLQSNDSGGDKKQYTCGLCGETGHNASTCPRSRACGICGKKGHNSATCPKR